MQILKKQINEKIGIIIVLAIFLIAILLIVSSNRFPSDRFSKDGLSKNSFLKDLSQFFNLKFPSFNLKFPSKISPYKSFETEKIKKFSSEKEFKAYAQASMTERQSYSFGGFGVAKRAEFGMTPMEEMAVPTTEAMSPAPTESMERVSETNVQVLGIDEPDIVKTNGKEIYFSSESFYAFRDQPLIEEGERSVAPSRSANKTKIISAFPPVNLASISKIDETGTLLLNKNILVIFSNQIISGYDISNPKSPEKKWNIKLEGNVSIADSRLYKDKIYLVTKTWIDQSWPCQIKILTAGKTPLEIKCIDIYHPVSPVPVDTTFVAMVLDPSTGKIEKNISFVGSSGSSVVYMSKNGIYITYSYFESIFKFFLGFAKENQDIFPKWLSEKMEKLEKYDIGPEARLVELQTLLEKYQNSLNKDEKMKMENEISNRIVKYYKAHQRELEKTGIVKIDLEKFEIVAVGSVPGYPLNQFALDEYKDNLRIAVTVGERSRGLGFVPWSGGRQETANDVYVLDKDLKIQGAIEGLGLTERIYSARFIEDRGYLVTFRQTDPFYVLDLSDPKKPELKGELKIPGYSSYLHPISNDIILGIGKEGQQVKLSLFDVASPKDPKEVDKYILDEYDSEVLGNHRAFLLDKKHNIFFLPGSKGGYIFSYEDNKLKLIKAISQISAKRALFINDYLYIVGDDKITILNETSWEKVNELIF